jgi:acetyl esterase/lipase
MLALLALCAMQAPNQPVQGPLEVVRDVPYGKAGERVLSLDLVRLRDRPQDPSPVILFFHGGGWRSGNKERVDPAVLVLARQGFVCASVEYRLSGEARFPAQIHDAKAAVRHLRKNARTLGLDAGRIGAWGPSAGGHLAALLGTTGDVRELEGESGSAGVSSRIHAAASLFGPTDLTNLLAHRRAIDPRAGVDAEVGLLGGAPSDRPQLALWASPLHWVSKDDPPFLLVHGRNDRLVPPRQSEVLHEALTEAGVRSELVILPTAGHSVTPDGRKALIAFFTKELATPGL